MPQLSVGNRSLGLSFYQLLVEQAPDAVIFSDAHGLIRVWNTRASDVFGYSANEVLGGSMDLIIPQDLRKRHWKGFLEAIQRHRTKYGGRPMVTRALRKSGEPLYVELAFSIVLDESARALGAMAIARDVTQNYLTAKAALNAEAELHSNGSVDTPGDRTVAQVMRMNAPAGKKSLLFRGARR